jgi:hypothetical protein
MVAHIPWEPKVDVIPLDRILKPEIRSVPNAGTQCSELLGCHVQVHVRELVERLDAGQKPRNVRPRARLARPDD